MALPAHGRYEQFRVPFYKDEDVEANVETPVEKAWKGLSTVNNYVLFALVLSGVALVVTITIYPAVEDEILPLSTVVGLGGTTMVLLILWLALHFAKKRKMKRDREDVALYARSRHFLGQDTSYDGMRPTTTADHDSDSGDEARLIPRITVTSPPASQLTRADVPTTPAPGLAVTRYIPPEDAASTTRELRGILKPHGSNPFRSGSAPARARTAAGCQNAPHDNDHLEWFSDARAGEMTSYKPSPGRRPVLVEAEKVYESGVGDFGYHHGYGEKRT